MTEEQDRASYVSSDLAKNFEKRAILTSAFCEEEVELK